MTDQTAPAGPTVAKLPPATLAPDAIGVVQDTVIGMSNSAPAVSVGLTLAGLAAVTAYGSGPIILLTAIPMLIIANAYRKLNMWNSRCGASFEWVGRAVNPYLGFFTGWLMLAGSMIGVLSGVIVLAPSVLAIFNTSTTGTWSNVAIATAVVLVVLGIAVVGIRPTARTQVGMAAVEYAILIGFAILGIVAIASHSSGTFHFSSGWLSVSGIDGRGSAVAGFLLAVFMYTGWDASVYVNEETKRRSVNPGRGALFAVAGLAIVYTLVTVGLQGAMSPKKLAEAGNNGTALISVAQALAGPGWERVMALALALSVIASTGTGVVILARISYGMASSRVLPPVLATINRRFSTPVIATLVIGVILIGLTWLYLLTQSVQNAFYDVIDITGLLYAAFYVLTALATIVYYRRRVITDVWSALTLGILPVGAAGFLVWLLVKSLQTTTAPLNWSLVGVIVIGLILMLVARLVLRSPFFGIRRESDGDAEPEEAVQS
jgi:amino acid transporter